MLVLKPDGSRGSLWADASGNILTTTDPEDATDLPVGAVLAQYLSASGVALKINEPAGWGDPGAPSEPEFWSLYDLTDTAKMYEGPGKTNPSPGDSDHVAYIEDLQDDTYPLVQWDENDDTTQAVVDIDGSDVAIWMGENWQGLKVVAFDAIPDARAPWWIAAVVRLYDNDTGVGDIWCKDHAFNASLYAVINQVGTSSTNVQLRKTVSGTTESVQVNTSGITTTQEAVVSFGYDGTNLTIRVNKGTKATQEDTRSLPATSQYPARFGQGDLGVHFKAIGMMDHYPDAEEEDAAIEDVATIAGLTL